MKSFIKVSAPVVTLEHVRIIDGTGATPLEDQTLTITDGVISNIGGAVPADAQRIDLTGHTVMPGLVGMHEHLFYPSGGVPLYIGQGFSFPRLYLASGVTTARTAGTMEPQTDLDIKKLIDAGKMPGPKLLVMIGYLEGKGSFGPQMPELEDEDAVRQFVKYWAARGAHSFKAYMNLKSGQLKTTIEEAHALGLKVSGHLCAVGYRDAAALGIDNLEHGMIENTELDTGTGREADTCYVPTGKFDVNGSEVQAIIADLVKRNVAITSTLAVYEYVPPLEDRFKAAMSASLYETFIAARSKFTTSVQASNRTKIRNEAAFELAFMKAGGLLMAGCDPTGNGGVVAGFGDQRNLELLVDGGFTPLEAIKVATYNGAKFLGMEASIGSVAVGKQADLVVVSGNPAASISDVKNVKIVFKDGVGYDPDALLESVKGQVGLH